MTAQDPQPEVRLTDADITAVLDCLKSGWLTMGPRTQELEGRLGEMLGIENVVGLASGFAGLSLALRALGVGPGDRVIAPATAGLSVANAVSGQGARLVLCDAKPGLRPGFDPDMLTELIADAKVVIASHSWGFAEDLDAVARLCTSHGAVLIEDVGEAMFARDSSGRLAGTVADTACFDMSASSLLPVGEGGFLASRREEIAASAKSLRSHAMSSVTWERHRGHGLGYDVTDIGFNYRIDEPRSALALSRLDHIAEVLDANRRAAFACRLAVSGVGRNDVHPTVEAAEIERAAPLFLPIAFESGSARDSARAKLGDQGAETGIPTPLHRFSAFSDAADRELPLADRIADQVLLLPCGPAEALSTVQLSIVLG